MVRPLVVVLIGASAAAGLLLGLLGSWLLGLTRWARHIPTGATPGRADLLGAIGVVVTPIAEHGYGEVRVRVAGHQLKLHARATDSLPLGTEIFVIEATSHASVVVEPLPRI